MATYKETVGTAVVNYAGNYPGAVDGELWYDSTNKDFKYQYPNVTAAGSWRTGNSLGTARYYSGSAGLYTSGLVFGGEAKLNEFDVDGYKIFAPQGSNDFGLPNKNDDVIKSYPLSRSGNPTFR